MNENDALGAISALKDEDYSSEGTFRPSGISTEDFTGEIGRLLKAVLEEATWTRRKRQLVAELKQCLEGSGYNKVNGHGVRYVVSQVGESFIYQVPASQHGHLRPYRGKKVRVVCIGSGSRSYRTYMVGQFPDSTSGMAIGEL
ncbi:hypothetical protein [Aestuariivirga litoralis]|uniref:hypothetical protein n=1 Tax=Aestuariivirga litoralis TaxID=2650924 RepID=UPI0011B5C95D|nr:hypothetical protein [Aestuariivirga litoralis]